MPRQIEGINSASLRKLFVVEQPPVEIPTESVNQDNCLPTLSSLEVAQRLLLHNNDLGRWSRRFHFLLLVRRSSSSLGNKGVQLRIGDRAVGNHAKQACNGYHVVHFCHLTTQDSRYRSLEDTQNLVSLDLHD